MARDLTSGFTDEITADTLRPAYLMKADFKSGSVYAWTGFRSIDYESNTYTGLGDFISITSYQETQEVAANGVQFILTGIKSSLLSLALDPTEYHWRNITLWFAVLNENYQIINDPYELFQGYMDVLEINSDGETGSIVMNAENNLIDLKESRERRYTPEDQKRYFPDDLGLDYIPANQDIEVTWGNT